MIDQASLLTDLNAAQQQAVSAPLNNLLILAGAGSGKTRVLVHRLAWLMEQEHVSPQQILSVTFTNKAAKEMQSRVEQLLHIDTRGLWIGTFHSLAHRLLRLHYEEAKLPQSFQILDSNDQQRLVKRVMKSIGLDDKQWSPREAQQFINRHKDKMKRPQNISCEASDFHTQTNIKIYQHYQQQCDADGLVDFSELLLRVYELFRDHPTVRQHYQQRFHHILIDEFQDTNRLQYAWLKQLKTPDNYMMAVGDDDQSIYGWRGAEIANIQQFQQELGDVHLIRLEQNYRSTQNILEAANAVIAQNTDRLGKSLWTDSSRGEPIALFTAFNEQDEAQFVVKQIQGLLMQGYRRDECAILYRSNAQSRVLEEQLLYHDIPYRIYGGLRFFERAEIKSAMAYLRLVHHPADNEAFERIINFPTRGLGDKTVEHIRATARELNTSLWAASQHCIAHKSLPTRALTALQSFVALMTHLQEQQTELDLPELTKLVIEHSRLIPHYEKEPRDQGQARIENLGELINASKQFYVSDEAEGMSPLAAFISHAALESGELQADQHQDSVQLMTLHSAKGLEFPIVFMVGMEEQLFPAKQSAYDPKRLEEERRLCYVGITRAQHKLYLTHAEYRRLYGENAPHTASRFLREIPKELVEEIRLRNEIRRPLSYQKPIKPHANTPRLNTGHTSWHVGQMVTHAKFGEGMVLNYEGNGPQARIQVRFGNGDSKWLVASALTV